MFEDHEEDAAPEALPEALPEELSTAPLRRFAREHDEAIRYACPDCGAHAPDRGMCLVCCRAMTLPLEGPGGLVPWMPMS